MIRSQRDVDPSASTATPAMQRRGVIAAARTAVIGLVLRFTSGGRAEGGVTWVGLPNGDGR